eukprot:9234680-Prorocentrum_lima.AAC.1
MDVPSKYLGLAVGFPRQRQWLELNNKCTRTELQTWLMLTNKCTRTDLQTWAQLWAFRDSGSGWS